MAWRLQKRAAMKKWLLGMTVVLVAVLAARGRAEACGSGGDYTGVFVVLGAVAAVDVAFTVHDVSEMSQGRPGSRGAGVAELLLVGPQALIIDYAVLTEGHNDGTNIGVALGLWTTALAVHGIWALAAPEEHGPPPLALTVGKPGVVQAAFMPTMVSDGKQVGAGLGAVGRF